MDAICGYCGRRADHMEGSFTVCDSKSCAKHAQRDIYELNPPSLTDLLARYGGQK